jgi:hypothetical protein
MINDPVMELVLFHPYLENYRFYPVKDSALTLFQKNLIYPSVAAFIQSSPKEAIALDPYLARYFHPLTKIVNSLTLAKEDPPDYILTTFKIPRRFGDAYEWQRQLNLANVVILNNQLHFTLHFKPTDSKSKLYLTNFESYLL